jgi:hypothetical protein
MSDLHYMLLGTCLASSCAFAGLNIKRGRLAWAGVHTGMAVWLAIALAAG